MGIIIRSKTFMYEDIKNSSEGIFFPEKCCCIMICAYMFVFIVVFYFKRNERREKFDKEHFRAP